MRTLMTLTVLSALLAAPAAARGQTYAGGSEATPEARLNAEHRGAFEKCIELVNAQRPADAEPECRHAVDTSNQMGEWGGLTRADAHEWLGHSLYLQQKRNAALDEYQQSLAIWNMQADGDDAERGEAYAFVGNAKLGLKDYAGADEAYMEAIAVIQTAIVHMPSTKDSYSGRLKTILTLDARVKRALGDVDGASVQELAAEALDGQ